MRGGEARPPPEEDGLGAPPQSPVAAPAACEDNPSEQQPMFETKEELDAGHRRRMEAHRAAAIRNEEWYAAGCPRKRRQRYGDPSDPAAILPHPIPSPSAPLLEGQTETDRRRNKEEGSYIWHQEKKRDERQAKSGEDGDSKDAGIERSDTSGATGVTGAAPMRLHSPVLRLSDQPSWRAGMVQPEEGDDWGLRWPVVSRAQGRGEPAGRRAGQCGTPGQDEAAEQLDELISGGGGGGGRRRGV